MGGTISNVMKHPSNAILGTALGGVGGGLMGAALTKGSGPGVAKAGQISPMQALQQTGGAPLLAGIAMGADPNQSLMSFFGASGDYNTWLNSLDPASRSAIQGLSTQLNSISKDTQLKTQAVQKLVSDFPDFMASAIPKYKGIADAATQAAAEQALNQTAAKYAAGGNLSSGATAAAMARTAAGTAEQNLNFGANLAGADWQNQFNASNALLNFQQKMLGQGAQQGQSAIQQMWGLNQQSNIANAGFQNQANIANQNSQNAMWGAVGQLGGTALGAAFGGPWGAAAGGQMGAGLTSGSASTFRPMPPPPSSSQYAPYGGINP